MAASAKSPKVYHTGCNPTQTWTKLGDAVEASQAANERCTLYVTQDGVTKTSRKPFHKLFPHC